MEFAENILRQPRKMVQLNGEIHNYNKPKYYLLLETKGNMTSRKEEGPMEIVQGKNGAARVRMDTEK